MSKFAFLYERYIEKFVMNLIVENEISHSLTDSSIDFEGVENCKSRTAKNLVNPWYIWYNKV